MKRSLGSTTTATESNSQHAMGWGEFGVARCTTGAVVGELARSLSMLRKERLGEGALREYK